MSQRLSSSSIDGRLNLEQQRKRAKELLAHLKAQDPHATLQPLLTQTEAHLEWPRRVLALTALGHKVLSGTANWLDHASHERWVGGVCLRPRQPHWAIDEDLMPVQSKSATNANTSSRPRKSRAAGHSVNPTCPDARLTPPSPSTDH